MVNFGPLAAEICWQVWGIPANVNGFHVLAVLEHGTLVMGVSQTLRRWTEGATYIWQGDHRVGHWPTFLVSQFLSQLTIHGPICFFSFLFSFLAFSAFTLLVWYQEKHPACKNWVIRCWIIICLERGANVLHMVQLMPSIISCFIKIENGLTFLVPAYPDIEYLCWKGMFQLTNLSRLSWKTVH